LEAFFHRADLGGGGEDAIVKWCHRFCRIPQEEPGIEDGDADETVPSQHSCRWPMSPAMSPSGLLVKPSIAALME
jgi:hypothetical protein